MKFCCQLEIFCGVTFTACNPPHGKYASTCDDLHGGLESGRGLCNTVNIHREELHLMGVKKRVVI